MENEMQQKFCIDCAYMQRSTQFPDDLDYAKCTVAGVISLVSGERSTVYCQTARLHGHACGSDAKLFKASRTPDFRDGRNPRYDDDWGSPVNETAPDGRLIHDVHK